jgi:hypothetical protein
MSMLEETLTGTSKRPSSGGSTPVERARDPWGGSDQYQDSYLQGKLSWK